MKVQQRRGNAANAQLMLLAIGGPAVLSGLDQLGDQIRVIDNGVRREAGDDRPLPDGRDLRLRQAG